MASGSQRYAEPPCAFGNQASALCTTQASRCSGEVLSLQPFRSRQVQMSILWSGTGNCQSNLRPRCPSCAGRSDELGEYRDLMSALQPEERKSHAGRGWTPAAEKAVGAVGFPSQGSACPGARSGSRGLEAVHFLLSQILFSTSWRAQDMLIARAQTNLADRYHGQAGNIQ